MPWRGITLGPHSGATLTHSARRPERRRFFNTHKGSLSSSARVIVQLFSICTGDTLDKKENGGLYIAGLWWIVWRAHSVDFTSLVAILNFVYTLRGLCLVSYENLINIIIKTSMCVFCQCTVRHSASNLTCKTFLHLGNLFKSPLCNPL